MGRTWEGWVEVLHTGVPLIHPILKLDYVYLDLLLIHLKWTRVNLFEILKMRFEYQLKKILKSNTPSYILFQSSFVCFSPHPSTISVGKWNPSRGTKFRDARRWRLTNLLAFVIFVVMVKPCHGKSGRACILRAIWTNECTIYLGFLNGHPSTLVSGYELEKLTLSFI